MLYDGSHSCYNVCSFLLWRSCLISDGDVRYGCLGGFRVSETGWALRVVMRMSEIVEPVGRFLLDPEGSDGVFVYHDGGTAMVWIMVYGHLVGLKYQEALKLSGWLHHHAGFLQDRVKNYYECRDCGQMHHKSMGVCPALSGRW